MNSKLRLIGFASVAAMGLSGCFIDDTAQMATTTKEMADTTKGMAKTTEGMAGTTDGMATTTTGMAATTEGLSKKTDVMVGKMTAMDAVGRKAGAGDLRSKMLALMDQAKSQDKKIDMAATYFQAFEFQLTEASEISDAARTNVLYDEAMAGFFHDMPDYMPSVYDRSASPTSSDNRMMDLYALAATMHFVNGLQTAANAQLGIKTDTSVLSLVKTALSAKSDPNEAHWIHEARTHIDDAIYLLQVRSNFTAALALAKVSDVQRKGFLGLPGVVTKLKMILGGWNAKTNQVSDELLADCTDWLKESNDTRVYLSSIGKSAEIDKNLLKIFKDMRIPAPTKIADPKEAQVRANLLDAFKHEVTRFVSQSQ